MQALRQSLPRASLRAVRGVSSTPVVHAQVTAASSSSPTPIPLSNVEAQWEKLSSEEQLAVHNQLAELQKKDWKELSLDEKKAAYYIAFGPHGPRTPVSPPGSTSKVVIGTLAVIGAAALSYYGFRSLATGPPKTMTKEWQEASNERAKEMNLNPISGISSEGYKGDGYVTRK